jgi:DNA-binding TFAR19-related protein (PDSD5 family)
MRGTLPSAFGSHAVLDYNAEPEHVRTLLLHRLTVEARTRLESSGLSRREVMRRLGTSASQLYRLLDTTNTTKSLGQMVDLLQVLGCDVDVIVTDRDRRTA